MNAILGKARPFLFTAWMLLIACWVKGQVDHDAAAKTIRIRTADQRIALRIDYSRGCKVTALEVNNQNTLAPRSIFTAIRTADTGIHKRAK